MKTKICLNLDQVQAGQTLAADVSDAQGNCLIAAGVVLSDNTIRSLQQRGIETLVVWGQQLSNVEIAEHQTAIKERLAHRFRKVQDNPEMRLLHDILLSWQLESFGVREGDK